MMCLKCDSLKSKITNSRKWSDRVTRRRECVGCGNRTTTHEMHEDCFIDGEEE